MALSTPTKAQQRPGKQANRMPYDLHVSSLDGFSIHVRLPGEYGPFGESVTREHAKVRRRSESGPENATWVRVRPVDALRAISSQEFL